MEFPFFTYCIHLKLGITPDISFLFKKLFFLHTKKMSQLNLTVKVHPVVLFQIVDSYERRNADSHRVIGTLLGNLRLKSLKKHYFLICCFCFFFIFRKCWTRRCWGHKLLLCTPQGNRWSCRSWNFICYRSVRLESSSKSIWKYRWWVVYVLVRFWG